MCDMIEAHWIVITLSLHLRLDCMCPHTLSPSILSTTPSQHLLRSWSRQSRLIVCDLFKRVLTASISRPAKRRPSVERFKTETDSYLFKNAKNHC